MSDATPVPWLKRKKVQIPLAVAAVLVLFSLFIMAINYSFPSFFQLTPQGDGRAQVKKMDPVEALAADSKPDEPGQAQWKKGLMLANTMVVIGEDLFANWLPNDKIWPTIFLDNPQNHQLGQLEMLRYTARVMRDKLTRLYSTDKIDPDCDEAFTLLSNDAFKWVFPSAESRFKRATEKLAVYRDRLNGGTAEFYPTADNLSELLDQYVSLLGGVTTRLANAPNRQRYKISDEPAQEVQAAGAEQRVDTHVPWTKIDDNFYYAQGVAYVLRQMMVAVRYDFSEILGVKGVTAQVDSVIEVLDKAQFEPLLVLNGDVGSVLANHSMELHSLLENTRQRIRNLNDKLRQ